MSWMSCASIPIERDVLLGSDAAHIENSISHPAQGCVDADAFLFCDFLETHIHVVAHLYHFALAFGQTFDQSFDIFQRLFVGNLALFAILVVVGIVAECDASFFVGHKFDVLLVPINVDDQIVRDT